MSTSLGILEISRRTGISPAHVSKIFSGQRCPSLANAALLASALKISIDELYVMLVKAQEAHSEELEREERIEQARLKDQERAYAKAAATA